MSLMTTSSQTVGPYLKIGMDALAIEELAPAGVSGERISLRGRVLDVLKSDFARLPELMGREVAPPGADEADSTHRG